MKHMIELHRVGDETPDDVIRRYRAPSSGNSPDTLDDQLTAMKETGFWEMDCYFNTPSSPYRRQGALI